MARRYKKPQWFKLQVSNRALIDAVDDAAAGRGVKLALAYFETGEVPEGVEPLTLAVFNALKVSADEAIADYQYSVEAGAAGAAARWGDRNG